MKTSTSLGAIGLGLGLACGTVVAQPLSQAQATVLALARVPPAIEAQFEDALLAWKAFSAANAELAARLKKAEKLAVEFEVLDSMDFPLHKFLYPWVDFGETILTPKSEHAQRRDTTPGVIKPQRIAFVTYDLARNRWRQSLTLESTWQGNDIEFAVPLKAKQRLDHIRYQYRGSGKWYWEARFHEKEPGGPMSSLVGVSNGRGDLPDGRVVGFGPKSGAPVTGNAILQFALDIDRGRLYVGVDGNWRNGDPSSSAGGKRIPIGDSYVPAAHAHRSKFDPYKSEVLTFNFGATSFRYRIPEGFDPYDFRFRGKRHAESIRLSQSNIEAGLTELDRQYQILVRKTAEKYPPELREPMLEMFLTWVTYRNRACALTGAYLEPLRPTRDLYCMTAFNENFVDRLTVFAHMKNDAPIAHVPSVDVPSVNSAGAKLHYVSVSGDVGGERRPVKVRVTDSSAPLILVFQGTDPYEWRVSIAPKVSIRHVLLFGDYKQTLHMSGARPPFTSCSGEEKNCSDSWASLRSENGTLADFADSLRGSFGIASTSMQFDCPLKGCLIDGVRSWRYQSISKQTGRAIGWLEHVPEGRVRKSGSIVSRAYVVRAVRTGKRVTNIDLGSRGTVVVSEARNKGKWFFEVQASPVAEGRLAWAGGTLGILDVSPNRQQVKPHPFNQGAMAALACRFEPGRIVGVALDLEEGRAYCAVDGEWIDGDPTVGRGGKKLKRGRDYFPAIAFASIGNVASDRKIARELVDGGTWIGRFAEAELTYPIPPGYQPYETSPRRR